MPLFSKSQARPASLGKHEHGTAVVAVGDHGQGVVVTSQGKFDLVPSHAASQPGDHAARKRSDSDGSSESRQAV